MNKILTISIFCLILVFNSGCSGEKEKEAEISLERTKLVLRLFDSLAANDYQTSLNQARKLRSFDPNSPYILTVIELENINLTNIKIQKALDENKLEEAYKLMHELNSAYPLNTEVTLNYAKIKLLYELNLQITDKNEGKVKKITFNPSFEQVLPLDYRNIENAINRANK